jgi:hypothetical protein
MKKYIGVKIVEVKPMARGDYNKYRGWELPSDEDGDEDGYLVEYTNGGQSNHPNHKGYISWSPKKQFEEANRPCDGMTFGHAIEALKLGKRIARKGWNGKGMFVFKQVPSPIPSHIVPVMTSLPQSVKDEFVRREQGPNYVNQMAIVKPDGSVDSWVASSSDTFADDWQLLD